jgi:predicted O-methyltransferase YrrM
MRKNNSVFNDEYLKRLSYIKELYVDEDNFLKNIRNDCLLENRPITINSEEGKLLQILIELSGVKKILEIGTLFGYSTIWLVRAISRNNGKIVTIEKNKYYCKKAEKNFKKLENDLEENIKLINGNAIEELNKMIENNEMFDMIFIDADKINYFNYLELSKKLVKKNGLIVADNTFLSGAVYLDYLPERIKITTQQNMKNFNRELANQEKYETIMFPTEEGLSLSIKKF